MKDLLALTLAVSVSFFILSGAGIFSAWFWFLIF